MKEVGVRIGPNVEPDLAAIAGKSIFDSAEHFSG